MVRSTVNASYQVTEIQGIPWVPGLFFGLALLAAGVLAGYYYRDWTDPGEVEDAADDTDDSTDEVELKRGTWQPPLRWVANGSTVHRADCSKARKVAPIEVWTPEAAAKWALAAKPPLKGGTCCHPFAQLAVAEVTP